MTNLLGIFGIGGCGRGIMPVARQQYSSGPQAQLVFVDDQGAGQTVNGHEVMSLDQFASAPATRREVAVAIASSRARQAVVERCRQAGLTFLEVRAGNAVEMDDVQIGEGAIISPFVTFTSNIRIGDHFHANLYSYVEHDCVIGDYVTFAPGVRCNGNVRIGDPAYLGAGAVIRQGKPGAPLRIGAGAVVGMGAVVTRDVAPGETVVGNPARPMPR